MTGPIQEVIGQAATAGGHRADRRRPTFRAQACGGGPRRRRKWAKVAAVMLLMTAPMAGCGSNSDGSAPGEAATPSGGTSGSPSAFADDVKGAASTVQDFWAKTFAANGQQFRPIRRVFPYTPGDGSTCAGEPLEANNASYCPSDDDIGFDQRWLASMYRRLGDAFVYYLFGHEYGHAIQARLGAQPEYTIQGELQADCYAGAYMAGEIKAGNLQLETGDVQELLAALKAVGDPPDVPWFDAQAHGTPEQRTEAFGRGFDQGLTACRI